MVLVPTGGGWANKEGEKEGSVEPRPGAGGRQSGGEKSQPSNDVAVSPGQTSQPPTKQGSPPTSGASKGGAKLWSSVTGNTRF